MRRPFKPGDSAMVGGIAYLLREVHPSGWCTMQSKAFGNLAFTHISFLTRAPRAEGRYRSVDVATCFDPKEDAIVYLCQNEEIEDAIQEAVR